MLKLLCSKAEKAGGLRHPGERAVGKPVRLLQHHRDNDLEAVSRDFYPAVSTSGEIRIVPDAPYPAATYHKAQRLIARITAVGAAIAIGFLASDVLRNS
jgi:hypothetical protein